MTMSARIFESRAVSRFAALGVLLLVLGVLDGTEAGQRQSAPDKETPASARARAVIDVTGYWVSIIDEDWMWRMMTPAKGDYTDVPLNADGKRVTKAWDPEKDQKEGNDCRAYGAANIMRMPTRLHITWVDDNTLQVETDAGTQKRLFHFDGSKWRGGQPQWQGDSVATWEKQPQRRPTSAVFGGPVPGKGGNLHVFTTHMRPGYLSKNGIPYSGNAVLNERFRIIDVHGTDYLILRSVVEDPTYLTEPFTLSSQFQREPDGSKWDPTPCRPLWPLSLRTVTGREGPNESQ
jgi:hypothetical protein